MSRWIPAIGLEVHAPIRAAVKIFSGGLAKSSYESVNEAVAFFDLALPGSLPVLNKRCVEAGVLTALALSSTLNRCSFFDRKHYFYPDLPSSYQITQHRIPLAYGGQLDFPSISNDNRLISIRIKQLHLEQDSSQIIPGQKVPGGHLTLVDYNRAGKGLMEIVTEPDLTSGNEAAAFVNELQVLLKTLATGDEDALRVDANISVRHTGADKLGIRTEVKNIQSWKSLSKAIDYEVKRHIDILESGGVVEQETRSFDKRKNITLSTRGKGKKQDYRFMAEPDLTPLVLTGKDVLLSGSEVQPPLTDTITDVDKLRSELPELPMQTRSRLNAQYGLSYRQISLLMNEEGALDYYCSVVNNIEQSRTISPQVVFSWVFTELWTLLKKDSTTFSDSKVSSKTLAQLIDTLEQKKVPRDTGLQILKCIYNGDSRNISQIVSEVIPDFNNNATELREICISVVSNYSQQADEYRTGVKARLSFFIHKVMAKVENKYSPQEIRTMLEEIFKGKQ